jgi:phosphodiesterase/alkaline phosphatase D-like protein
MPIRAIPEQAGRTYRRIEYGARLDVFLIDMRGPAAKFQKGCSAEQG